MDRRKWQEIFTNFQACARGYLVRNEVRRAREDFEDIVNEIDGDLTHLQWRDTVIPIPHFTDTDVQFLPNRGAPSKLTHPGPNVSNSPQSPAATLSQERVGNHGLPQQRVEAERDDSEAKGQVCFPSGHAGGHGQDETLRRQKGDNDGGGAESAGDSTTVWSSLDLDMNYSHSHQGPRQYRLAQEVPRTPEALRLHRNTLTMELVWLQQAIDSRKKYLLLKDKLAVS